MNYFLKALASKHSGSALHSYVGGRMYLDVYPKDLLPVKYPYVVYFIVSDINMATFTEGLDEITIQYSLFSASEGATEITTMYNNLKTLLDDCTLSITGSTFVSMERQDLSTSYEEITTQEGTVGITHWSVDYLVRVKDL